MRRTESNCPVLSLVASLEPGTCRSPGRSPTQAASIFCQHKHLDTPPQEGSLGLLQERPSGFAYKISASACLFQTCPFGDSERPGKHSGKCGDVAVTEASTENRGAGKQVAQIRSGLRSAQFTGA